MSEKLTPKMAEFILSTLWTFQAMESRLLVAEEKIRELTRTVEYAEYIRRRTAGVRASANDTGLRRVG